MVVNQDLCIGCGICTVYCPADAITIITNEDGKRKAYIDQEACLECGTCRVLAGGKALKTWSYPVNGRGVEYTQG